MSLTPFCPGVTWHPLTDAVHAIRGITALAVAPSQASVVYAGTGSIFGTEYGSGVWKSTDAVAHWQSAGLQQAGAISWLLVKKGVRFIIDAVNELDPFVLPLF